MCRYIKIKKIRCGRALIYIIIASVQLFNGSRISESISAFNEFIVRGCDDNIKVRIAKSGETRNGTKTKKRYRSMTFPKKWFDKEKSEFVMKQIIITHPEEINLSTAALKKKVYDYMMRNYNINTDSLRYAYIEYMIFVRKMPVPCVAKQIGHINSKQLSIYIDDRKKRLCDELPNLDLYC